ncbi:AAA family ATPase [Microcoleus sp. EPA2]|uniref:trifunctional serine/threonine-protein kinase/ATP-binding protein/sensor histidine kinase n=1 Tax=Microcoleus sp. EPA2 TaxID=2841654 RepID=UPI00312B673F
MKNDFNTQLSLKGYQVTETLYQGTKTEVCRARKLADKQAVVIKILRQEYPSFGEMLNFRNQYIIAKNLQNPGIVSPLCLETYRHSYALVMEDFGGISLREYTKTHTLELTEFLEIALQLSDILHYLYQNRVIHKDIKPANILIHPETKQVKLIDFSISSLLPKETPEIKNPSGLEGTLAYISPEQTGRMNRGIDYRSDLYSLGITLFELLTGNLPFISEDPMELVHCHIAKQPPLARGNGLSNIGEEIPQVLAEIVMKLMAKNAEDRYQSALGLKHDLEHCLHQWLETRKIEGFEIGKRDICDRFTIPEKLYGRESEVRELLEAFDRVANPSQPPQGKGEPRGSEMMLVAGFSGLGKTAVVNEVHKPIVRQRGYFIKGKFDQFNRNIPFSAFVQAFRDLMGQLLSESDAQLQRWKAKIIEVVGENGQVLIEVIPELENIIGTQPAAPELSGSAAQNRFHLLMQNFVQIFTSIEHPLVIFLDDLQWADLASLNLLQLLMQETGYLLVLGAYRDNEVFPAHPFLLTVDELVKNGATVNTITLLPLSWADTNQLVADTLKCDAELALPLTELLYQKTQGNPFFATQFLKALHEDKLITFHPPQSLLSKGGSQGGWQCDIAQVKALALTDDVVEFMALQLQKLPPQTQEVLKLAACMGGKFELNALAIVSQQLPDVTAALLWKALQSGLIIPITEVYKFFADSEGSAIAQPGANATYKFLHDRVQQAAYSLIPADQKPATHLQIGQLLQQNYSETEREEKLFEIVGHLNLGQNLIGSLLDREALAQLNLKAGQKAKNSTAYSAAVIYLQTGIELLQIHCWQNQYELTLNLYVAATAAAYLNGEFEDMEQRAALVLQQAQTILDKFKIYEIQIAALTAQSQILEAIAVGRNALAQLGVELPNAPDEAKTGQALQTVGSQLSDKQIEELANLPVMSDAHTIAAMQLMGMLFAPILMGMPGLLPLLCSTMVSLSLQFGNAPVSTMGYAGYGMVLSAFLGQAETGYRFGLLALSLLEQFNLQEFKSAVLSIFGSFLHHQQAALSATRLMVKDGYRAGMETGQFLYAGYNILNYFHNCFFTGVNLDAWTHEVADYSAALAQAKQYSAQAYLDMTEQTGQNFREASMQPECLIGIAYDERVMIPKHHQAHEATAIAEVYIFKLLLAYSYGNYGAALDYVAQVQPCFMAVSGMFFVPIFHFYAPLTELALFPAQSKAEQAEVLIRVEAHQTTLHQWARNAPMNYLHKWHLVEAEKSRVLGKTTEAIEQFDRALALAQENQFLHEEALANELAAKFYLDWGKTKVAQTYMQEAYYCYARWGAKAKVEDLEKRYPQLLQPILQQRRLSLNPRETIASIAISSTSTHASSSSSISDALDFASVLKAAQAISSSIQLDELMASLTRILLENSGAKKTALILLQDEIWQVRAVAYVSHHAKGEAEIQTVLDSQSLDTCPDVPRKIIQYVKNTHTTVIIDRLQTEIPGLIGEYMLRHQPQSVLCTPIINQGHLAGILYLENKLTSGVFTSDRLQVINVLASQAAISIENARLYQQSQQALVDLQQAQLQIVQSEKMSALGNLVAGVAHEINNPLGFIAGNIKEALAAVVDLTEYIHLYQEKCPYSSEEVTEKASEIDLEYMLKDLPNMLNSMKIGCERIKGISVSLRTFSRADKDYKVPFNIHEGIDSTILILKHRLKANEKRPAIAVVKNYGDLPQIQCFPGQLNQVFMNILANAIDALDESNTGRQFEEIEANPNRITITTSVRDNQVQITIADNGRGMSEEVQQKIFDHLFTTKGVGKGTGLGLAIARQIIVEKHGGIIETQSTLGTGTKFMIKIPIHP